MGHPGGHEVHRRPGYALNAGGHQGPQPEVPSLPITRQQDRHLHLWGQVQAPQEESLQRSHGGGVRLLTRYGH